MHTIFGMSPPTHTSQTDILASLAHLDAAVADVRRLVEQQWVAAADRAPRATVASREAPATTPRRATPRREFAARTPSRPRPAPASRPTPRAVWPLSPSPTAPSTPAARPRRGIEQWIGSNALAVVGGGAVLLGIVFFVAVAIRRGLIPPGLRMAGAALTCAGLLWLADVLHRRFRDGPVIPRVLTAVGIVGGFATLLGTVGLFALLPQLLTYPLAVAVAATGVLMAYRLGRAWPASLSLGLAAWAAIICVDGQVVATALFSLIVLAVAGAMSLRLGPVHVWALAVPGAVQACGSPEWGPFIDGVPVLLLNLGLLTVAALITVGNAIVHDRRRRPERLSRLVVVVVPATALATALLGHDAARLVERVGIGDAWMLGLGAVYLAVGVAVYRMSQRIVGELVAAVGFAQIGVAMGLILDGPGLIVAWCAQAVVAAWAAARMGDRRPLLGSAAALVAAMAATMPIAPGPVAIVEPVPDVTQGVIALAAWGSALAAAAFFARGWFTRFFTPMLFAASGVVLLQAASVALAQAMGASDQSTQVTLSACWAVVGLTGIVVGLRHRVALVRIGGLSLLYAALAKLALFDLRQLDSLSRAASFVLVGALALGGAFAYQRLQSRMRPTTCPDDVGEGTETDD